MSSKGGPRAVSSTLRSRSCTRPVGKLSGPSREQLHTFSTLSVLGRDDLPSAFDSPDLAGQAKETV